MNRAGLCETCQHVRRVETKSGSVFYMCSLAQTDRTLRKYPPLPVLNCHGYGLAHQGEVRDDAKEQR